MPLNLADINTDYIIQKYAAMKTNAIIWKLLVFLKEQRYGFCRFFSALILYESGESKIGINQDFAKMIIVQV